MSLPASDFCCASRSDGIAPSIALSGASCSALFSSAAAGAVSLPGTALSLNTACILLPLRRPPLYSSGITAATTRQAAAVTSHLRAAGGAFLCWGVSATRAITRSVKPSEGNASDVSASRSTLSISSNIGVISVPPLLPF